MTQQPLSDYFSALDRIKKGRPVVISKNTKITNDAVALEAGRGKGSIKKSRDVFANLIMAIDEAATEQAKPMKVQKNQLNNVRSTSEQYRSDLEAALVREISLISQVYDLKKVIARLTGGKVLPIRSLKEGVCYS